MTSLLSRFIVEQDEDQLNQHVSDLLDSDVDNQQQQDNTEKVNDVSPDTFDDDQQNAAEQGLQNQDPNKQGLIRTVPNAHLVYKRVCEDGTFEELWMYNVGKLQDELDIRKKILAGTDIPVNKRASPDGKQKYDIWSAGNAELLHIMGLPN